MTHLRQREAIALMTRFAERTGLHGDAQERRYLWTDAFATCNFLGLWQATGDAAYREGALRLVDAVHRILGTHRADDVRRGRLAPGASDAHPTRGGLRIGKPLPERPRDAPLDERQEWNRDGQYFHYLTKWMHALDQTTRATGQAIFTTWARELADTAHRAFSYRTRDGVQRMHWKMSIDLSRPLVASMGQHDPLDGLITCWQLKATASGLDGTDPVLAQAAKDFASMLEPQALATADPLGLGGLLTDAYRVEQLVRQGSPSADPLLLEALLAAAESGLAHYARRSDLGQPAERRLAFRELGLAIGLTAVGAMEAGARETPPRFAGSATARTRLRRLAEFASLGAALEADWLEPAARRSIGWQEHQDINDVMLATSLVPEGFLVLHPPTR